MAGAPSNLLIAAPFDPDRIAAAMAHCHDGYSSDEVLIRDDLRDCFLQFLQQDSGHRFDQEDQRDALLALLKLRKAGQLNVRAVKQGPRVDSAVFPVAEIASRVVTDRHRISSDTLLADSQFRRQLQAEAELITPGIDPYLVRKAVLLLRKQRALRPELVLQVAQWNREIRTLSVPELRQQLADDRIPSKPGIYLFRDHQGYLYIGEAADLAARLAKHLSVSDRPSLAEYLAADRAEGASVEMHIFDSDSPIAKGRVRRAYESELIRSRKPKFNVRP